MFTVGFIGNGKRENRYHIPFILQRSDKIKIKMIYTRKHSRDVWDEIPGVIYTEDLQELLNDQEVQVIIISTPSQSHYELAKTVLNAGKNCVVEKPGSSGESKAGAVKVLLFDEDDVCLDVADFDGLTVGNKKIIIIYKKSII